MMKANKLVIGNLACIFLILAWSSVPNILKNDKLWDAPWYNIIWIVLFFIPIIAVFILIKKTFGGFGVLFGGGKKRKKILSEGRPAMAEVIELGENSGGGYITINEQPVVNLKLRIHDGNKPPYEVSFDSVISRMDVPQFQPGVMIPVRIDPLDPNKVVIDTEREPEKPVYGNVPDQEEMDWIKTRGKKGTAKVISVEDTGKIEGSDPIVKVTLEVSGPDIKKYPVAKEIPVPKSLTRMFFPGTIYPCVVDPENPESVVLETP
jgi:hypothetical protein